MSGWRLWIIARESLQLAQLVANGFVVRSSDPIRQETRRPRHPTMLTSTREAKCRAGRRTLEWRKAAKRSTRCSSALTHFKAESTKRIADPGSLQQSAVGSQFLIAHPCALNRRAPTGSRDDDSLVFCVNVLASPHHHVWIRVQCFQAPWMHDSRLGSSPGESRSWRAATTHNREHLDDTLKSAHDAYSCQGISLTLCEQWHQGVTLFTPFLLGQCCG